MSAACSCERQRSSLKRDSVSASVGFADMAVYSTSSLRRPITSYLQQFLPAALGWLGAGLTLMAALVPMGSPMRLSLISLAMK